jgi:hypothetical protein
MSKGDDMGWTYQQATGRLSHDREFIATGYAGIGQGLNNPASQNISFVGPLPAGTYTIGGPMLDGGHMGPFVLPLTGWVGNQMFGRDGFFIHGDNTARNNTASNGCIVLDRIWRQMIATSGDTVLIVIP